MKPGKSILADLCSSFPAFSHNSNGDLSFFAGKGSGFHFLVGAIVTHVGGREQTDADRHPRDDRALAPHARAPVATRRAHVVEGNSWLPDF